MEKKTEFIHGYVMEAHGWKNCYVMEAHGWKNCYDHGLPKVPGLYMVEDHAGHRFTCEAVIAFGRMVWYPNGKDFGYDICWWKERSEK